VAILDWYSRHVLSWELSTTLDTGFCLEALGKALRISKPKIFNSDQGVQFTAEEFRGLLKDKEVRISMGGRGRVYDNIFVERLWRSVKYEEVCLHEYLTVAEARRRLFDYFTFYNEERPREALDYRTPHEVYFGTRAVRALTSEAMV
jgi:putative transposase